MQRNRASFSSQSRNFLTKSISSAHMTHSLFVCVCSKQSRNLCISGISCSKLKFLKWAWNCPDHLLHSRIVLCAKMECCSLLKFDSIPIILQYMQLQQLLFEEEKILSFFFSAILEVHLSFVGERKLRIDSTCTRLLRFLPVFCSFCFSTTQIDTLEVLTECSSCKHLTLPASSAHFSISIGIIPIHWSPHSTYSHPSWEVSVLISQMVHKEARKESWC